MAAGDKIQLVTLAELQAQVTALTNQVQTLLIAQGLPAGGTAGQILTKQTEQDYAATWMDPANGGVPAGGTVGPALIKASDQAQDVTWGNLPAGVPAGGTTGQVLKKLSENDGDTGWGDESGGGGGGVQKLEQTTTSTESGGLNVWTATLEDGSQSTLEVRNGEKGNAGEAATVAVGNVGYGSTPNVNNSGNEHAAVLDFTLPMTTVENAQVYSQEETVIGTWIDGKPIYRKCFDVQGLNVVGNGATDTGCTVENLDRVLYLDGVWSISAWNGAQYTMNTNGVSIYFDNSTQRFRLTWKGTTGTFSATIFDFVVEYTKTTDEATVAVATAEELNTAYDEGVQGA